MFAATCPGRLSIVHTHNKAKACCPPCGGSVDKGAGCFNRALTFRGSGAGWPVDEEEEKH